MSDTLPVQADHDDCVPADVNRRYWLRRSSARKNPSLNPVITNSPFASLSEYSCGKSNSIDWPVPGAFELGSRQDTQTDRLIAPRADRSQHE